MSNYNPVTSRRIAGLEAPARKGNFILTWMKRKGVPAKVVGGVLMELGLYDGVPVILGSGAFGLAVLDRTDKTRIVKFTSDGADAQIAARLLAMYREPEFSANAKEVAPRIYGVWEVPYTSIKTGVPGKFWVIKAERVYPLIEHKNSGPLPALTQEEPNWKVQRLVANVLNNQILEHTSELQRKVYRLTRRHKPVTPQIRGQMVVALDNLASGLEFMASRGDDLAFHYAYGEKKSGYDWDLISNLLQGMGNVIRIMIERLDLPVLDLHSGNWGVRLNQEGEWEPVVLDFGLSSGGDEPRNEDREILEITPNPYALPDEQHFMPNPSAPKVSGYEGMRVQYDLAKGDLTQFGEMVTPEKVYEFAKTKDMIDEVRERLYAIYINNRNKPLGYRLIASGGRSGTLVDMPVVFGPAMALHARGLFLVHNHPGGKMNFSQDDVGLTERVIQIGKLHGVQIIDHLIVTHAGYMSLQAERPDMF